MARREHQASEYADLMEKYMGEVSLLASRKRRLDQNCEFVLKGDRFERLPCGQAELRVYEDGWMKFEYSLRIPAIEDERDMLLRAINGENLSGGGGLSFYLLTTGETWRFVAETRLRMDCCSCASARRQALEVRERVNHVQHALRMLEKQLPEFFGEEALADPEQGKYDIDIDAGGGEWKNNFVQPGFDEEDFVENNPVEEEGDAEFDFSDMCDMDELIGRYENDGIESLSGSELIMLHTALNRELEKKKTELALLQQIRNKPATEDDCIPEADNDNIAEDAAEDDGVRPKWEPDWGDEAEFLRRADEEGTEGMSFFDLFRLSGARSREAARREKGLAPLYQPRGNAGEEGAEEDDPGEKPVRNIPLKPRKW